MGTHTYFSPTLIQELSEKNILEVSTTLFQTAVVVSEPKVRHCRDGNIIRRQMNLITLEVSKRGDTLSVSQYELLR